MLSFCWKLHRPWLYCLMWVLGIQALTPTYLQYWALLTARIAQSGLEMPPKSKRQEPKTAKARFLHRRCTGRVGEWTRLPINPLFWEKGPPSTRVSKVASCRLKRSHRGPCHQGPKSPFNTSEHIIDMHTFVHTISIQLRLWTIEDAAGTERERVVNSSLAQ